MNKFIDPDEFGCSSKIEFAELVTLSSELLKKHTSDFSSMSQFPGLVTSVDRVAACSEDPEKFAKIAIAHVLNDVRVALAQPHQIMISFEFSRVLSKDQRAEISAAFFYEAFARGLSVGKCHSVFTNQNNAVTISVIGKRNENHFSPVSSGEIFLSRPIGAFKLHYLAEIGSIGGDEKNLNEMTTDWGQTMVPDGWSGLSDVSGHGLLGALCSLAIAEQIDLDVRLHHDLIVSEEVLAIPNSCLHNHIESYPEQNVWIDDKAWPLLSLIETAGPIVGLRNSEDCGSSDPFGNNSSMKIGSFCRGTGKVVVKWSDEEI